MVIPDPQTVHLALPSITADLSLSASAAQWVTSAHLLSFGGLLLLGGRSADLLGRRRVLLFGPMPGLGACAVAWAIAALTGVAERESGVASGINTAAFQIGGLSGAPSSRPSSRPWPSPTPPAPSG